MRWYRAHIFVHTAGAVECCIRTGRFCRLSASSTQLDRRWSRRTNRYQ